MAVRMSIWIPLPEKHGDNHEKWREFGESMGHSIEVIFPAEYVTTHIQESENLPQIVKNMRKLSSQTMCVIVWVKNPRYADLIEERVKSAMRDQKIKGVKITSEERNVSERNPKKKLKSKRTEGTKTQDIVPGRPPFPEDIQRKDITGCNVKMSLLLQTKSKKEASDMYEWYCEKYEQTGPPSTRTIKVYHRPPWILIYTEK